MNEYWWQPARGADRAVLLAHGAGGDWDAPALATFADALAAAGIPVLRFRYPYRSAGRRAPDGARVLAASTRAAAGELASRSGLAPDRLVLGGRSMGGRYCSLAVGDAADPLPALGLLLLGYPLHPAGRTDRLRVEHLPRIAVPTCFVSGTRDALAERGRLRRHARKVSGPVSFWWVPDGDHGFRPRRTRGHDPDQVLADAAAAVVRWVRALPGRDLS